MNGRGGRSDLHPDLRCDGCATISSGLWSPSPDSTLRYCPGCRLLLDLRSVDPGDHEQYCLPQESSKQGGQT